MTSPSSQTLVSIESRNMVGIWVFVLSDAVGFAALLTTLMALRTGSEAFANAEVLPLAQGSMATGILVAISISLVIARRSDRYQRLLVAIAALLSAAFCVFQYFEYQSIFATSDDGRAIPAGLESFVVISGYHLVHVAAGLVALLWGLRRNPLPLGPLSVYWHFVDGLWLFIFALFYLF